MALVHVNGMVRVRRSQTLTHLWHFKVASIIFVVLCGPLRAEGQLSCLCTSATPTLVYSMSSDLRILLALMAPSSEISQNAKAAQHIC